VSAQNPCRRPKWDQPEINRKQASTGLAITGTDLLSQAAANASSTVRPNGSHGIGMAGLYKSYRSDDAGDG
jgi:hypothetical protein